MRSWVPVASALVLAGCGAAEGAAPHADGASRHDDGRAGNHGARSGTSTGPVGKRRGRRLELLPLDLHARLRTRVVAARTFASPVVRRPRRVARRLPHNALGLSY